MILLTAEKTETLLQELTRIDQLTRIDRILCNETPSNNLESLERFENRISLDEIKNCFIASPSPSPEEVNDRLVSFLSSRWARICNTNMCYTHNLKNPVNQLCIRIAKEISAPALSEEEIQALSPMTGPYLLLMPTLKNSIDVYGENIHSLGLDEFVISDDERVFIPLAGCLNRASYSDDGKLYQMVMIGELFPPELTPAEIERVAQHSRQANTSYNALIAYNKQRLLGNGMGSKLTQLAIALRRGGAHGSGQERNAGSEANLGILAFHNYWLTLSEHQHAAIFKETPALEEIIGRLFRPKSANYEEVIFCVEMLANRLDPIIQKYNEMPDLQNLLNAFTRQVAEFANASKTSQGLAFITRNIHPKHLLQHLFKLSPTRQQDELKHSTYQNALTYATAYCPEELPEFVFDDEQKVIWCGLSALTTAMMYNRPTAVRLLIEAGVNIHQAHNKSDTLLNWAACEGYIDIVALLLEKGACITKNRNSSGRNAFDIVLERHSRHSRFTSFIEMILMHVAKLQQREQAECLSFQSRGCYPNVLFYAAANNTALFVQLLDQVLLLDKQTRDAILEAENTQHQNILEFATSVRSQPNIEPLLMYVATLPLTRQTSYLRRLHGGYSNVLFYAAANKNVAFFARLVDIVSLQEEAQRKEIFNVKDKYQRNALLIAAKLGVFNNIHELAVDIESKDVFGDTALHHAAYEGHISVVRLLLERGASPEAKGYLDNTALNQAVLAGREEVVQLLLEKGADINSRNNENHNALDNAIQKNNPQIIEAILIKVSTLSQGRQANVIGSSYQNVLFYANDNKPALFNRLVDTILAQDTEEQQAILLARNAQAQNALDIAIEKYPEIIDTILIYFAKLSPSAQSECLRYVPGGPYSFIFDYVAIERPRLLNHLILQDNTPANLTEKLSAIQFDAHIERLCAHYQRMKHKSLSNSNYLQAVSEAKDLILTCSNAKKNLFLDDAISDDEKIQTFKATCLKAIEDAKPELEKHREWGKVLTAFIFVIMLLPISIPLYLSGFFSKKTKSEQLLVDFTKTIRAVPQ